MTQMLRSLLTALIAFVWFHSYTQIPAFYQSIPLKYEDPTTTRKIERGHQKSKLVLPQQATNAATKKFTENQMEIRLNFLKELQSSGDFILETELNTYVDRIFQTILKANPELDQDMTVLISRNPNPNAFNTGDHLIVVHLGLLERLQTEGELAFVLSHEIAHQAQNHVMINLISKANYYGSDSVRNKIASIKRSEYLRFTQYKEFILPGLKSSMAFSRAEEFEADSIGLQYFLTAGHAITDALLLIEKLKHFDEERDTTAIDYSAFFSHPQYPFISRWLYVEEISSLGEFTEDSTNIALTIELASHPDAQLRYEKVKNRKNSSTEIPPILVQNSATATALTSRLQIMNDHLLRGNYSKAMRQLAYLFKDYPNTPYLRFMQAYIMTLIAVDKKLKQAGKHLDTKGYEHSEHYNQLLNILWEMKSSELLELSDKILSDFSQDQFTTNPHIAGVKALNAFYLKDYDAYQSFIALYQPIEYLSELNSHLQQAANDMKLINKNNKK
jgi:predicted Zn-dependent protease